jgi:predicted RNA binding protein YcfA (HicA-like mRNA interferase family)
MSRLRSVRTEEVVRALRKAGFEISRQHTSHVRLRHADGRRVTVPVHPGQEIGRGLLRKIIRDAEMSVDEFFSLL